MNKPRDLPPLSDAQMEVMQRIWDRGEATVSDVWQDLANERKVARNTVLTVMDRLAKRGWLTKRSLGNTHLYKATIARQKALGRVVERLIESTFCGSVDRLVMALLDGRGVTDDEALRIRRMINDARKAKDKS